MSRLLPTLKIKTRLSDSGLNALPPHKLTEVDVK